MLGVTTISFAQNFRVCFSHHYFLNCPLQVPCPQEKFRIRPILLPIHPSTTIELLMFPNSLTSVKEVLKKIQEEALFILLESTVNI